eukprot:scaffold23466_cov17-Tisochrysis_lutea.AAC.1
MFLPARGKLTITNPCAKITAYPYLSYKLGTVLKGDLIYGNPQSWPRQENALPEHTWDLQVIAVWSTAARVQLDNQNPIWIQDLARDISEAKRYCQKLPLEKKKIAKAPHEPATEITAPTPCQSNPNLQLKVARSEGLGIHGQQPPASE